MTWTTSYYHYDAVGSTRKLTDSTQAVTDRYTYDAFGNQRSVTGATGNPFRYVGQVGYYFDPDTGTMNVRTRMYQTAIIRWLNEDPLHFGLVGNGLFGAGYNQGLDGTLYRYVQNSPTNYIDPTGLKEDQVTEDLGGHIHHSIHHAASPCCGRDVTNYLGAMIGAVQKRFDKLTPNEKYETCQDINSQNGWDITEFNAIGAGPALSTQISATRQLDAVRENALAP